MKKLIVASITAILLASPIVSHAGSSCKNIKFAVQNNSDRTIKLVNVRYRNVSTGKTKTEKFRNLTCGPNRFCRTAGQNLPKARNVQLNNFVFQYRILYPDTGKYSRKVNSLTTFMPNNTICIANRTYGGRHWSIGNYVYDGTNIPIPILQ